MTVPLPYTCAAAVILADASGRVLIAERPAHKPVMPGYWEFPGGKLEEGETPEACMVREAQEEISVVPVEYRLLHIIEETRHPDTPEAYRVSVHVYLCSAWRGEVHAREGQGLAWVEPSGLAEYKLLPANFPLIPLLVAEFQRGG